MSNLLNAANRARTTLSENINAFVTSFSVADASAFPAPPFVITIEEEIMEVGTVNGNTFSNVQRGQEGTAAAAHSAGAPVENRFTAGTYNRLVSDVNEQRVKVAKIDNEFNYYRSIIRQLNPNHEAKQTRERLRYGHPTQKRRKRANWRNFKR